MKAVQEGSYAVITQKCNKTANINVKKLQFIHKLTASDTSKTAKMTKRWYCSAAHQHLGDVLLGNITFLSFSQFFYIYLQHLRNFFTKQRRSAVIAFLGVLTKYLCSYPQNGDFGGPFHAKLLQRAFRKSQVNGVMKLKLYSCTGIGKYLGVCQHFSTMGRPGGAPHSRHC